MECSDIREILTRNLDMLRDKVHKRLTYECEDRHREALAKYMSYEYKTSCIKDMDAECLLSIFFHRPVIHLVPTLANTGCEVARVEVTPITNSVFARDPQIITARGLVMNRMHTAVRNREVEIYELAWLMLGIHPIARIPEGGLLEGGDFMTIKPDLALCGVGMRSNAVACEYLMEKDLLGTRRFGMVLDREDNSQQRMHLDTYFNMVNATNCLLLDFDTVPNPEKKNLKRYVRLFTQDPSTSKYSFEKEVELGALLEEEGIRVIPVTHEEQLAYLINFIIVD